MRRHALLVLTIISIGAGSSCSDDAAPDATPGARGNAGGMTTFFPSNLSLEYLADVGDVLSSPQAMRVTVPAGQTIDVVVYAIDVAPGGVDPYRLSCSA